MDSRFPFGNPRPGGGNPFGGNLDPQADAQVRAALGISGVPSMEQALYLQMQADKQRREFELQQMLVRGQLAQGNRMEGLLPGQHMQSIGDHLQEYPDLQQQYSRLLLGDSLHRGAEDRMLLTNRLRAQAEEELRRRQQLLAEHPTQHLSHQHSPVPQAAPAILKSPSISEKSPVVGASRVPTINQSMLRDIAADSLAGNAVRRGEVDKRKFAQPEDALGSSDPLTGKKRPQSNDSAKPAQLSPTRKKNEKKKPGPKPKKHSPARSPKKDNRMKKKVIAADILAGNAVRRGEVDKRKFAQPDDALGSSDPLTGKKRPRSNTSDSAEPGQLSPTRKKNEKKMPGPKLKKHSPARSPKKDKGMKKKEKKPREKNGKSSKMQSETAENGSIYLLPRTQQPFGLATPLASKSGALPESPFRATIGDILDAAHTENISDSVATFLARMKEDVSVAWSDADDEASDANLAQDGSNLQVEQVVTLPNFSSVLPRFPVEPSIWGPSLSKKVKRKGLLDDDSVEEATTTSKKDHPAKSPKSAKDASSVDAFKDLPYLVDKWWPSSNEIKKERKLGSEADDDQDTHENSVVVGTEQKFCVNPEKIKDKLSRHVQPGVLEKVPHCKIHRMLLQRRKSAAPELVHCWQVTELYPNDAMVCCSHCGTWRHAACGGHHKPFSVREAIEMPFVPVCDRCYEENKILEDNPVAKKRLDRQRNEQIRRGLSTSAAMRQASFAKHGGSYKWPLGSVSATHIGGHTRSVHTRHDKAEKQWTDMTVKLSKGYGNKPKDKIKHRTKELERLLVSVEDAEGHNDRHNMLVFLLNDTQKTKPTGYEDEHTNLFDPADDKDEVVKQERKKGQQDNLDSDRREISHATCLRPACGKAPRFDSLFCSDACGVCRMETDLRQTFQYSSEMHPSSLRH